MTMLIFRISWTISSHWCMPTASTNHCVPQRPLCFLVKMMPWRLQPTECSERLSFSSNRCAAHCPTSTTTPIDVLDGAQVQSLHGPSQVPSRKKTTVTHQVLRMRNGLAGGS
ncbi:hypothetical protein PR001_g18869 [Phytophthora rubi]|uniref:Secreted protein n=1 Tax=Phytophthora rubi TaxID=129364 RepID=A0A6A3JRY6_9STRA|nr:hypothetical protein PR002_g19284 [Phytophthora rubi]KAE9000134.1 hypothetical protein PR001_g18869 [Phytophthora rubi]